MKRLTEFLVLASAIICLSGVPAEAGDLFNSNDFVGVPRPFIGGINAIRGVPGGGRPWIIDEGSAKVTRGGELRVKVEGLMFDPEDQSNIDAGLAGRNTVPMFRAILSCLTIDDNGNAVTVNLSTGPFPATVPGGDSEIRETLENIPDPCIAPIVFVTNPGGSWFAATGF